MVYVPPEPPPIGTPSRGDDNDDDGGGVTPQNSVRSFLLPERYPNRLQGVRVLGLEVLVLLLIKSPFGKSMYTWKEIQSC